MKRATPRQIGKQVADAACLIDLERSVVVSAVAQAIRDERQALLRAEAKLKAKAAG
jgi:hypothetical protein